MNFSKQSANEQQCYAADDSTDAPERPKIQSRPIQELYLTESCCNIQNCNFSSGRATSFLTLIKENTCRLRIYQYKVTKVFGPKRKDTRKWASKFTTTYFMKFVAYIALYSKTLSATKVQKQRRRRRRRRQ
jgi:hypothetical protein